VRQTRQAIRRAIGRPRKKDHRHRLRRPARSRQFRRDAEVTKVIGNADKYRAAAFANENKVVSVTS
jgi:hypothetical protein